MCTRVKEYEQEEWMPMEENHTIWIEKYRPLKLADIVGQDEIVERLSSYVKSGNLPHLLFTGVPVWARRLQQLPWHVNFLRTHGR
jgi:replication-associated recombination protein RarA